MGAFGAKGTKPLCGSADKQIGEEGYMKSHLIFQIKYGIIKEKRNEKMISKNELKNEIKISFEKGREK